MNMHIRFFRLCLPSYICADFGRNWRRSRSSRVVMAVVVAAVDKEWKFMHTFSTYEYDDIELGLSFFCFLYISIVRILWIVWVGTCPTSSLQKEDNSVLKQQNTKHEKYQKYGNIIIITTMNRVKVIPFLLSCVSPASKDRGLFKICVFQHQDKAQCGIQREGEM